ncbi:YHYH protein [Granulicella rosea]|uniref:YHYH protein n=1 Tax=Granulicella rosea TaxID=474952 RepID=A0A239M6G9_9BACT|nr:YHYH protein [Granulicella rosea]SNT38306.1 YHYH protein [Granulicella rosea]
MRQTFLAASLFIGLMLGCTSGTTSSTGTTTGGGTGGSTNSSGWTGGGDGIWRRNAVYAEAVTFDPCNAHQPGSGEYHYHDNPICLRYQLGDNVQKLGSSDLNPQYAEVSANFTHSPILGWTWDGYPVYGPYGYSNPASATSGVRRMVSSYSLRNITVRQTLPAWAAAAQNMSTTLTPEQYGPVVSTTYPLGRYIEDFDYTAGAGDLDQYNGRFTVTPDFPNGTYAYFVTIDSTGAPAFPYYIASQFYGTASGGAVSAVTETTTTYFNNGTIAVGSSANPTVYSWLTKYAAQYAKVISESNTAAGAQTTWSGTTSPVLADIQQIRYSSTWAYINTSGLASHTMGPWYLDAAKTQAFPNYPSNQNALSRIPITPSVATTKTATGGGAQGRWVNGVAMFNNLDFHSWSYSAQADE